MPPHDHRDQSTPEALIYYQAALEKLLASKIPFLVGGGYALHAYTGIARMTKDFDIFVLERDVDAVLKTLAEVGYQTEITFSHWLAKAYSGDDFIDVIFNSGNGLCPVDAQWFEHASEGIVLGLPLKICPAEESIWQKAFIMERERFDGADIAHLLRFRGHRLDWTRLLERFGPHWRVLLSHLVLFGFVYPAEQAVVPAWVMRELTGRLMAEQGTAWPDPLLCRGTILSREQYLPDIHGGGYHDARLRPFGEMTPEQIERWTPKALTEATQIAT